MHIQNGLSSNFHPFLQGLTIHEPGEIITSNKNVMYGELKCKLVKKTTSNEIVKKYLIQRNDISLQKEDSCYIASTRVLFQPVTFLTSQ